MSKVQIVEGNYRGQQMAGVVGQLVRGYKRFSKPMTGYPGFITVQIANEKVRVKVHGQKGFKTVAADTPPSTSVMSLQASEPEVEVEQTDEEIMERLRERFEILNEMSQASVDGIVRGMVVTGPPGVGKTFGVEQVLEKASMFDKLAGKPERFGVEKGAASPIGLYMLLFRYADEGSVLVLDDCDSILFDELSLNLLKAALDSGKKRIISWKSESSALRREGIPEKFEFRGSIIFITNLKFDKTKGKIKDHLEAIMSRCHYLDLTMDTMRERILRVKQIVADGMLKDYKMDQEEENAIVDFMQKNCNRLREVSLRMVTKLADLYKMNPTRWQSLAESTCIKR